VADDLPLADALLFQLTLRGMVRIDDLAASAGATIDEVDATVTVLEADGLAGRRPRGADQLVAATPLGRERAARVVAAEGRALRPHVERIDAEFAALNARVKQILLRWQVRTDRPAQPPNDHGDRLYDQRVLAELRDVHRAADELLEPLAALRQRYASLRRRLQDKLARGRAGDTRAVAGVTGDSFHTAWWELHGDLLAILGRARGDADV
jgi:pyruvate,orthophosphate dikinase